MTNIPPNNQNNYPRCTYCGILAIKPNAAFCYKCGKPMLPSKNQHISQKIKQLICTYCGNDIKETDKFCINCGKSIQHSINPVQSTSKKIENSSHNTHPLVEKTKILEPIIEEPKVITPIKSKVRTVKKKRQFCTNCGTKYHHEGSKFCIECGLKIPDEQEEIVEIIEDETVPQDINHESAEKLPNNEINNVKEIEQLSKSDIELDEKNIESDEKNIESDEKNIESDEQEIKINPISPLRLEKSILPKIAQNSDKIEFNKEFNQGLTPIKVPSSLKSNVPVTRIIPKMESIPERINLSDKIEYINKDYDPIEDLLLKEEQEHLKISTDLLTEEKKEDNEFDPIEDLLVKEEQKQLKITSDAMVEDKKIEEEIEIRNNEEVVEDPIEEEIDSVVDLLIKEDVEIKALEKIFISSNETNEEDIDFEGELLPSEKETLEKRNKNKNERLMEI